MIANEKETRDMWIERFEKEQKETIPPKSNIDKSKRKKRRTLGKKRRKKRNRRNRREDKKYTRMRIEVKRTMMGTMMGKIQGKQRKQRRVKATGEKTTLRIQCTPPLLLLPEPLQQLPRVLLLQRVAPGVTALLFNLHVKILHGDL